MTVVFRSRARVILHPAGGDQTDRSLELVKVPRSRSAIAELDVGISGRSTPSLVSLKGLGLKGLYMSNSQARRAASVIQKLDSCLNFQRSLENKSLNAFISAAGSRPHFEREFREFIERDETGSSKSSLDGSLVAIKDNICTHGEPTTCASAILDGFQSPFQATVVEQLENAGAFVTGKTNLDEFGMGSHSTLSYFGPVRNRNSPDGKPLSAGGSSGGSAVAVATGQRELAFGTDTGGSVRLPAAYTGIVGFKPSYGLLSRWGVVAYANSLDTVGLMATKVLHLRKPFQDIWAGLMTGWNDKKGMPEMDTVRSVSFEAAEATRGDKCDPTRIGKSSFDRRRKLRESNVVDTVCKPPSRIIPKYRIGVPKEYNTEELDPIIRRVWVEALQTLHNQGHSIHSISLPTTQVALSAYYVIAAAEASSNLAKYDGVRYGKPSAPDFSTPTDFASTRAAKLGEEVKRRILLGSYTLSADAIDNHFLKAQKVRRLVQRDFDRVFRSSNPLLDCEKSLNDDTGVDFVITPTTPTFPPTLSSLNSKSPINAFADDVLTVPASLAGLPAVSVPIPVQGVNHNKSPERLADVPFVGLQVMGQYGSDISALQCARSMQRHVLLARGRAVAENSCNAE